VTNSKDAKYAHKLLDRILDLQKQIDVKSVEIMVTTSSVTDEIDFGATKIQRTAQGFLFTAKGGIQTLIGWRMQSVCNMIQPLFDFRNTPTDDEEEKKFREIYQSAVLYILQSPIFASLSQGLMYDIATTMLRGFNEIAAEKVDNAEPTEETEADIKEEIEDENASRFIDEVANTELPDYGDDEPTEETEETTEE
jgi:hypothetical protein